VVTPPVSPSTEISTISCFDASPSSSPRSAVSSRRWQVHGRPAPVPVLAQATRLIRRDLEEVLAELERRQMIERSIGLCASEVRIAHPRLRENLYSTIAPRYRCRLHLASFNALETGDVQPDVLFELAHHAWLAGDAPRARRYNFEAALLALDGYAVQAAI